MSNRWGIAAAGFLLQMALGAVYAWSVFRTPLVKQFHWSISDVTLTFTICIFVLGVAAFFGGLWLNKVGPARRRAHGWISLWPGRVSGELLSVQAVVAVSKLRRDRRHRPGLRVHRADCGAGEMVPGSPRTDHRNRSGRFRSGGAGDGAGGDSTDSECGRSAHLRVSWRDLSRHYDGYGILHAEPSGRMEAGRMDAEQPRRTCNARPRITRLARR